MAPILEMNTLWTESGNHTQVAEYVQVEET